MKRTIRLNESQIRRIVKESVKKVLKEEGYINKLFYWEISEMDLDENGKWEYFVNPTESSENGFKTGKEALEDGLHHLKNYKQGDYSLDVYQWGGNSWFEYCAEIHNGKIQIM